MNIRKLFPQIIGGTPNNYWNRLIGGIYEEEVVNFYQRYAPYEISVDIGAGVGYHTKKLAELSEKVVAIEPLKNPELPSNVDFYNVAVGNRPRESKMKVEGKHIDGSEGAEARLSKYGVEVEVVLLDSIVTVADFLKIDIEGEEGPVLRESKLIDNVNYAVIETHGSFDRSIVSDFDVDVLSKEEENGKFLFCKR